MQPDPFGLLRVLVLKDQFNRTVHTFRNFQILVNTHGWAIDRETPSHPRSCRRFELYPGWGSWRIAWPTRLRSQRFSSSPTWYYQSLVYRISCGLISSYKIRTILGSNPDVPYAHFAFFSQHVSSRRIAKIGGTEDNVMVQKTNMIFSSLPGLEKIQKVPRDIFFILEIFPFFNIRYLYSPRLFANASSTQGF